MSDPTTNVYLLTCLDDIYKIGIAKRVDRRLSTIQGCCPFPLTIVATFPSRQARDDENDLHDVLSPWRMRGEWFRLRPKFASKVKAYFAARREAGPNAQFTLAGHALDRALPDPGSNGESAALARSSGVNLIQ